MVFLNTSLYKRWAKISIFTNQLMNMKNLYFAIFVFCIYSNVSAQNILADQNPQYQISQAHYAAISDSMNALQSLTLQNTYKAYDWFEARQEKKNSRIAYKRNLKLEQAKNSYNLQRFGYYHSWGYNSYPYFDRSLPFYFMCRYCR